MYILFDIGATKIRVAFSPDGGTIEEARIEPTPPVFEDGVALIEKLSKEVAGSNKITAAAGGLPGPLNAESDAYLNLVNIQGWVGKPVKESFEKAIGTLVYLENDAALVGMGEATYGAGKGERIVVYMTLSTGVGGARFINGKVDENALGFEPGHQIIDPSGPVCPGCGSQGDLEAHIGGGSIEKQHGKHPGKITDDAVWDKAAKFLAIGLNNTILHWSPHLVVLGGSMIAKEPGISLDRTKEYLEQTMKLFPTLPRIELATLEDEGGLYGALAFVKQQR